MEKDRSLSRGGEKTVASAHVSTEFTSHECICSSKSIWRRFTGDVNGFYQPLPPWPLVVYGLVIRLTRPSPLCTGSLRSETERERVPEERIIRSPFAPPHLVSLFATSFPRPLVCIYIYIYTYSVYSIIVATLILRENENMRSVIGLFMETKEGRVLSHSLSRGRFLSWRKAAKRARRICKEFGRVGKFPSPSPYFLNAKLCFIVRYLLARERWGNNLDPRNQKLPFPEFSASTFRPN